MVIVIVTDMVTDHMTIIVTDQDMTVVRKQQNMARKDTTSITINNRTAFLNF